MDILFLRRRDQSAPYLSFAPAIRDCLAEWITSRTEEIAYYSNECKESHTLPFGHLRARLGHDSPFVISTYDVG